MKPSEFSKAIRDIFLEAHWALKYPEGNLARDRSALPPPMSSPDSIVPVGPSQPVLPPADLGSWFEEEVHPYEPGLRSFLWRHFPTIRDVDDLVQEAYARIFRAKSRGKVTNARSFLYTTARNLACDYFRRNRHVARGGLVDIDRVDVLEERPNAADVLSDAQDLEILSEAIQGMPPRCREVFVLRRLHGLSYNEISKRLEISEHTINAQLAIGVARCRAFLLLRGVIQPKPGALPVKEKK